MIASEDGFLAGQLQHAINSTVFRAYVNPDLVGVELCAAAKNVIASPPAPSTASTSATTPRRR